MTRRASSLIASLTAIPLAFASPAPAEVVLAEYDVFLDPGSWSQDVFVPNYIIAETFVSAMTGTVSSIQVPVFKSGTTTIPLSWAIRATYLSDVNGLQPDLSPTGALSVGALAPEGCPDSFTTWTGVPMTPAELQAGQSYALVATAFGTDNIYFWRGKSEGTGYSGRHLVGYYGDPQNELGSASDDVGFRILAIPEPSSLLLLLGGVVGSACLFQHRARGHRPGRSTRRRSP